MYAEGHITAQDERTSQHLTYLPAQEESPGDQE